MVDTIKNKQLRGMFDVFCLQNVGKHIEVLPSCPEGVL